MNQNNTNAVRVSRTPSASLRLQPMPLEKRRVSPQTPESKWLAVLTRCSSGDRTFTAGSTIFHENEQCKELYSIVNGWVALQRHLETGRRQIISFHLADSFLGYQPNWEIPMLHGARCLTNVTVNIYSRQTIRMLLQNQPEYGLYLAELQAHEHIRTQNQLINVSGRPARARVAHFLCELYMRVRQQSGIGQQATIKLPLTQEDIADALGLTSVYVNKTLRSLREEQIMKLKHGWLHILKPDQLIELAGFEQGVADELL